MAHGGSDVCGTLACAPVTQRASQGVAPPERRQPEDGEGHFTMIRLLRKHYATLKDDTGSKTCC